MYNNVIKLWLVSISLLVRPSVCPFATNFDLELILSGLVVQLYKCFSAWHLP